MIHFTKVMIHVFWQIDQFQFFFLGIQMDEWIIHDIAKAEGDSNMIPISSILLIWYIRYTWSIMIY